MGSFPETYVINNHPLPNGRKNFVTFHVCSRVLSSRHCLLSIKCLSICKAQVTKVNNNLSKNIKNEQTQTKWSVREFSEKGVDLRNGQYMVSNFTPATVETTSL